MGKKQRQFDQLFAQMQAQLARSLQPTQYENDINAQQGRLHDWLVNGNIRNPQDVNSFVNLTPLAQYAQEQQYSAGPHDAAAGVYNPQMQAADRIRMNDDINRKWGGMFEQNKANILGNQQGLENAGQNLYMDRMNRGVQGTSNLLGTLNQRPKGFNWLSLVGPAASTVASIF